MKKILLIGFVLISCVAFAQPLTGKEYLTISANGKEKWVLPEEWNKAPEGAKVTIDSSEYSYFAAYLAIQTSEVTDSQIEFTKKLVKYVKQNHGVVYIVLQSGIPPCVPTPAQPCPKN